MKTIKMTKNDNVEITVNIDSIGIYMPVANGSNVLIAGLMYGVKQTPAEIDALIAAAQTPVVG